MVFGTFGLAGSLGMMVIAPLGQWLIDGYGWQAGIVVVCAAGNRGRLNNADPNGGVAYGTINSPGNDPYVITVGAVNDSGTVPVGDDPMALAAVGAASFVRR